MMALKIAVLFLIVAGLVTALRRAGRLSPGSAGRRPDFRPGWVRLLCGLLGGGILVAMVVGTWREARSSYSSPKAVKIRIPALSPPEYPMDAPGLLSGRILVNIVVLDPRQSPVSAVAAESLEATLPGDQGRILTRNLQTGLATMAADVRMETLSVLRGASGIPHPEITCDASVLFEQGGFKRFGQKDGTAPLQLEFFEYRSRAPVFSLWRPERSHFQVLLYATPVRPDDPLRDGGLADLMTLHPEPWRERQDPIPSPLAEAEGQDRRGSPGEVMANELGINLLPMLAAAVLLSQLFRWPSLAFTGIALILVLFVAVQDRLILSYHQHRMWDASLPIVTRQEAFLHLDASLYFPRTAWKDRVALAEDPASPEPLRRLARIWLRREK